MGDSLLLISCAMPPTSDSSRADFSFCCIRRSSTALFGDVIQQGANLARFLNPAQEELEQPRSRPGEGKVNSHRCWARRKPAWHFQLLKQLQKFSRSPAGIRSGKAHRAGALQQTVRCPAGAPAVDCTFQYPMPVQQHAPPTRCSQTGSHSGPRDWRSSLMLRNNCWFFSCNSSCCCSAR